MKVDGLARSAIDGKRRRALRPAGWLLFGFIALLTVAPVVAMGYGSVVDDDLDAKSTFTTDALVSVYLSPDVWESLLGTLALAGSVAVLATLVGTALAWVLSRTDTPMKGPLSLLILAPLFTSPLASAVAWFSLAAPRSGFLNVLASGLFGHDVVLFNVTSIPGIVWVLVISGMPYAYLFVSSALENMDPSLEEASSVNGHGPFKTLRRITLPMVTPAILSSLMFITLLTSAVFSVPGVLGRNLSFVPFPVLMYRSMTRFNADYGMVAGLGTMMFLVSLIFLFAYRRLTKAEQRYVTVGGKGFRGRQIRLGVWAKVVAALIAVGGFVCVILPNLALLLSALMPYAARNLSKITLSVDQAFALLGESNVQSAVLNTLLTVVVTCAVCLALTIGSVFLSRYSGKRLRSGFDFANSLPLAVPGIVLGAGLLWVYLRTPIYGTIWLLVVAFLVHSLPYSWRLLKNGSLQISGDLEEASFINGASKLRTISRITAPLLTPSILASLTLVAILTIREVNAIILLYSPGSRVLSVLTWDFTNDGSMSAAATIGLLQTLLILAILLIGRFVFRIRVRSIAG